MTTKTTETKNSTPQTIDVPASSQRENQPPTPETSHREQERDEFANGEYIDPLAKLPRIQALRGQSKETCGYFISVKEMAKAAWKDFEAINDQLITYEFESSGDSELGLLLKNPRMLVCPRTPLLAFDRKKSNKEKQLVILGGWEKDYKKDENIANCQFYQVILLSPDNEQLHDVPFSYVAKGANHATFSQHWQELVQQVTACHAIANKIAALPKNLKFNALCVFSFSVAREQAGTENKSYCCKVASHEVPNMENWKQFFVGYSQEIKELAWENLQPERPLLMPETLALPASVEDK
ncbi:hypothetical protein PCC7424_5505 (plasmid) [Gloeothece citriformis PCC 7424]|uniref:DUF5895 domain-containing protein n=1 Tax=Gloeothece citriformis (strain PCC 7424) TaxID=65393 RepID=B7KMQ2_GLOC7|nr:DUF5895 domain-containing protein [Gloeothece citriformis]ACK74074.1 hypothetical protein PCC7424_5505 [Gloeothece citriformis PCC 7424]